MNKLNVIEFLELLEKEEEVYIRYDVYKAHYIIRDKPTKGEIIGYLSRQVVQQLIMAKHPREYTYNIDVADKNDSQLHTVTSTK